MITLKPGSQYDADTASVMSIVSITGKRFFFHESNYIPDVKFLDNLTGWTLANAGNTTLEKKLSLFQSHTNARDTTLAPVSYCVFVNPA